MTHIVCFGEVLWDNFPTHKKIGGAPLNVALRLQSLHNNVSIISRIGNDNQGVKIKEYCNEHGVNTENIQVSSTLNTGEVTVTLNQKGSASYDIKHPRAWDNIQFNENIKTKTLQSDAFIYGSLVAREEISRQTLYKLLEVAKYKVFDVNLRAPYFTSEVLNHLMNKADFIKFNDEEITEIAAMLDSGTVSLEQHITCIAKHTNTNTICVTRGSQGAIFYYHNKFYYNNGYQIEVKDTVGAGDSFLGSLIHKLIEGDTPQKAIDFACAMGAMVASREGANPKITTEEISTIMNF